MDTAAEEADAVAHEHVSLAAPWNPPYSNKPPLITSPPSS
jgi:hypothetical protein